MNRFKKFLSLSVLGAAALSMTAGACFLVYPNPTHTAKADTAGIDLVSESVANEIPSYFKTEGMTQSSTYFTKTLPLIFDAETIRTTTKDGTTTYIFGHYPDKNDKSHYYLFDDITISVKLNGKSQSIDYTNYIIKSTQSVKDKDDVRPQVLAMKIERGATAGETKAEYASESFNAGTLTLTESGLLEVTVSYGVYDTYFIANKDYDKDTRPDEYTEETTYTSRSFTYTAFLFDNEEYFEPACQDEPSTDYSSNLDRRASDTSATHKWEYFYNYQTTQLPSITYNANHVRLTITKNYNNSSESTVLVYNPNNSTITKPSFIKDVTVNDHNVTVYFNDVGVYNLHYDLIYNFVNDGEDYYRSFDIGQPVSLEIDGTGSTSTVLDQKVHILGAQLSYTDYTDNQFKEFKKFDNDNHTISRFDDASSFVKSADVTYLLNSDKFNSWKETTEDADKTFENYLLTLTPVSTNQTPLKLTTNLNSANATFKLYKLNGTSWNDGTDFSLSKNISEPGTYLITLNNYGYAGYTASNKTFSQIFYFTINKTSPNVNLTAVADGETETTLYSGEYTNKNVKIKYNEIQNDFDAPVRFELIRYDFINNVTEAAKTISFNDKGEYTVDADGKYTLNIYYGKQSLASKPIKRIFTIDTQDISSLTPYTVETSGANNDYKMASVFSETTNQPFVFTWENEKASGAYTYGYYKYFPLSSINYYSTASNVSNLIWNLLNNKILATDSKLNLNTSNSWNSYTNPESLVKNNASIPSNYINESAGLYLFQIFDQAGNSAAKIVLYDDSKPYFVVYNESSGYQLVTSNYTLTTDATVIWSENKAILFEYTATNFDSICTNKNGLERDPELTEIFETFLTNNIRNYSNLSDNKNGSYYISPLNSKIAYKDRLSESYEIVEMSQKDVQFSYTIHYTKVDGTTTYYISTSNSSVYLTMQVGESGKREEVVSTTTLTGTEINGNTLFTADIYMINGDNGYEYYYGEKGSLSLISLTDKSSSVTKTDEQVYINSKAASKVSFVDMEGTYVFLIRDASNTKGANLSQEQQYLRYASNYQYIKVSSDSSQMNVYYKESDEKVTLTDASFTRIETLEEEGSAIDKNKKSSYFNPTSVEQTLYVSFIPTIGKEGSSKITQVEKVSLAYYPYETKSITKLNPNNNLNIAFYRTLSTTPLFENDIYNFTIDGASETAIEKTINIDKNMTMAGRYILTRTYLSGEEYSIDIFDYYERTLTAVVDRYGVLTSPETISLDITTKYYSVSGIEATATKYGNIIIIDGASSILDNNNCLIENASATQTDCFATGDEKLYFVFDREVSNDFELVSNSEPIIIEAVKDEYDKAKVITETIDPSLESIVGGDILINMYDGQDTGDIISVSFPYYKENGLNSGDTFYTANNTNWSDDDTSVSTSLTTNKLPVKLYIPEVKYTIANEELYDESTGTSFANIWNDALTYFDTDENFKNTSAITPYQLVASIDFTPDGGTNTISYTSVAGENGFLAFKDDNGNVKDCFYEAGIYTVTITQGYYSDSNTSNNFRKNYKFGFVIKSSAPEFSISASGKQLQSLDELNYYTNEKTATISWEEDTDDRYIAKIDKSNIKIKITKSQNTYGETIKIDEDGLISSESEIHIGSQLVSDALTFNKSGKMNYLIVDFNKLGIYNNDDKLTITMQFEGHDDSYYQTTTKTIVIDKKASFETVGELISNLSPYTNSAIPLNDAQLRDFYDIDGNGVNSADEAAYNASKSVGYLKYYSYQVDNSFFQTLRTLVSTNNSLGINYRGGTIAAYYKQVSDPYNDYTETSYDNFSAMAFTDLSTGIPTEEGYYEIVEQDLAGNLTIYLVHKYFVNEDEDTLSYIDEENDISYVAQGFDFNDGATQKFACDKQILSNALNLYSSTNFSLNQLNFMGDKWLEIKINNDTFMLSPWLEKGQAYYLNGATAEVKSLNSIFASFTSSTTPIEISLSNRASSDFASLKFTLLDGAQLNTYLSETSSEEYISISYSNSVFPVKVAIYNGGQIYECENDPNALANLTTGYSYLTSWTSNDSIIANSDQILSQINFVFTTLPTPNSKIKYEITDNFGNITKVVHVYGQSLYNEVESSGSIYKNLINDETTNHEAQTYYISPVDLRFSYNDTVHTIEVFKWQDNDWSKTDDYALSKANLTTLTFSNKNGEPINNKYKIVVYEYDEDNPLSIEESQYVKTLYFHIYSMLPEMDETAMSSFKLSDNYGENITDSTLTDTTVQRITINGRVYTINRAGSTFASTVTFTFTNTESYDYPFSVYYYKEGGESSNFVAFQSGKTFTESGIYYFLMSYNDVLTNEYRLYKLEILDSATEFYRVTNNGKQVQKAGSYYTYHGREYSEYYIVNVDYNTSSSLIQIDPNTYQKIVVEPTTIKVAEGEGVFTVASRVYNYTEGEAIKPGTSPFDRMVFITYIPSTSQPVSEAYFTFNSADTIDMLTSSSITAAADKNDAALSSLKLIFSNSYGIANNLIQISVLKDGVSYPVDIKTEQTSSESGTSKTLRYIELTRSGTYTISLYDIAGNKQVFAAGTSQASQTLKLIFLKDVAFTMTYTDASGIEHTTDPIQKGVFNRKVSLTLLGTGEYYTAQSVGSGQNMITATRNEKTYTDFGFDADTKTFTFEKPGYYSIYFSATSTTGVAIREEIYNFTIVNPEESRYSFEYAPYNSYYISSISKDNIGDITRNTDGSLKQEFKDAYQTVVVGGKEYLKHITTSFLDDLTGVGRYEITVCTSQALNRTNYTDETTFSFNYWINTKSVPISVSVTEGEATSKTITATFNAERVFESVGECIITIGSQQYEINADTITSLGVVTGTISTTGTYFITVHSTSGNLLYSYKVIKNEPLNTWAILAICIGGVALIAVVMIIVKLRKRINVK